MITPALLGVVASGGASGSDPFWANVVLLMHCDGANGTTNFVDETGKTFNTVGGTAQHSTAEKKFGESSISLDGNDDHISIDSSFASDFQFGSGDFTVEAWIRSDVTPGAGNYDGILGLRVTGTNQFSWGFYLNGDNAGAIRFDYSTGGGSTTGSALAGVPTASTWSHVAAVRNGANLTVYLNGVGGSVHNIGAATLYSSSSSPRVGLLSSGITTQSFDGYLDEIRVTKGVARYTADFDPPTSPFPGPPA